jgi:molecular chaperone GrpE
VRRRAARDVENAHRFGVERFARELLAVVDSLEIGREAARGAGEDGAVAEGMDATLRLLMSVLEKFGVTPVEALGETFDPEAHEAIMTQPSNEAAPDTVVGVVQQGYRIHDRLLRPARVIVARPRTSNAPRGGPLKDPNGPPSRCAAGREAERKNSYWRRLKWAR